MTEENDRQEFAIVTKDKNVVPQSIYNRYQTKSDDNNTSSRQITEDKFSGMYDERNIVQPLYNLSALANLTEVNPFHQRCVNTKAQDIAGTGYEIRQRKDDPDEAEREKLENFFDEGKPINVNLRKFETDYHSTGNGYLELVREGHTPKGEYKIIKHIPSHTMRVHRDQNRYVQIRGTRKVWFKSPDFKKDVHKETGSIHELGELSREERASEVLHDMNYSSRSDFYGLPDTISALGAIQGHLSQRDYNIKFFENFGIPAYAVYITGDYDLEYEEGDEEPTIVKQIRRYLDKVQEEPHSNLVFGIPSGSENGKVRIEFEPLAIETKDAAFRMYRKDNRDEVIVAHGVPPYRIGLAETGSLGGSTAKESTKIYKTSIVAPRQTSIEYLMNRYVLRRNLEIRGWKFVLPSLEVTDEQTDRETLESLFERGGASPNDLIRNLGRQYGIDPVDHPAMNAHYINGEPITNLEEVNTQDAEVALQSLQNKLLKIAKKREMIEDD